MKDSGAIERSALFSELKPASRRLIEAQSASRHYASRQIIFRAGAAAASLYLVLDGRVQVYRGPVEGPRAILGIQEAGDAFGVRGALQGARHGETAESLGGCQVLEIPAALVVRLRDEDPGFAAGAARALAGRVSALSAQLERIQLMPTTERLADYLLCLAPDDGPACEIDLPFSKGIIAGYLGMGPESFSRAMGRLRGRGLTCRGRKVRIADTRALRDFSRGAKT